MSILVVAEHDNKTLNAATLPVITAANACGSDVTVLVVGHECQSVADEVATVEGVSKVLVCQAPYYEHFLPGSVSAAVVAAAKDATHVLAPSTTFGKSVLPRVAALLDVGQVSDIIVIENDNTFVRPIYAGNALATVESCDPIKVITVRTTAFEPAAKGSAPAAIETLSAADEKNYATFVSAEVTESERPELASADVVVSGGRGLQSKENFALIEQLADKLGAAVGASRAIVDAGFVPNDYQVGQTGKVVAPTLYIAVGISGAIQHLAGMKDSKVIVAINKDEEAPIFQVADYGVVGDLFEIVPELIEKL